MMLRPWYCQSRTAARIVCRASTRLWALAALAIVAGIIPLYDAVASSPLEAAVKANYLYKFGDFVGWPQSSFSAPNSAINLCILGTDPFGDVLDKAVAGQRIGERPIVVRRLDVVDPGSGCQILYVGGTDRRAIATILQTMRGAAVLTVTDDGDDTSAGIVRFVVKDNRVRFDIDPEAANANGLTISSKLLSLALSSRSRP